MALEQQLAERAALIAGAIEVSARAELLPRDQVVAVAEVALLMVIERQVGPTATASRLRELADRVEREVSKVLT